MAAPNTPEKQILSVYKSSGRCYTVHRDNWEEFIF